MSQKLKNIADEIVEALGSAGTRLGKSLRRKSVAQAENIREIIKASRKLDKDLADSVTVKKTPHRDRTPVDVKIEPFKQRNYDDQLREQLDALENISVADWVRNRAKWLENGGDRGSASLAAQQNARDKALDKMIMKLQDEGLEWDDAMEQASAWLKTQAATHRLDSIAGGFPTDISGVGDSGINSSIGSQWRSRVLQLDESIANLLRDNPDIDLTKIRMKINFG